MKITKIMAREVLDSRGRPAVEVDLYSGDLRARSIVPSGASTGAYEAHELRDQDVNRYHGAGVLKVLEKIENLKNPLQKIDFESQKDFDKKLLELDGTENKSNIGANGILSLSQAFAGLTQMNANKNYLFEIFNEKPQFLPTPLLNVINGGAHANNSIDVQEFMIAPVSGVSFKENLRIGVEVFTHLKQMIHKKGLSTAVGDEGGFAPNLESSEVALELLCEAIKTAGYEPGRDVVLALDVAATELLVDGLYQWKGEQVPAAALIESYKKWAEDYPLASIEDGLGEEDWSGWASLTLELGSKIQLVGDDLFVTNPKRIAKGVQESSANAVLIKPNQIGTVTETIQAVRDCKNAGWNPIMSHRSGETEDVFIADLAVGLGCPQIKTGSPCRGERTAKYNQLLRIDEYLNYECPTLGRESFK